MLYAIVAKPGEGKSYFAVTKIYDFQQTNTNNLKTNIPIYFENKKLFEDRGILEQDFTFTYDIGNVQYTKTTNYSYFSEFENEEQFENYFEYFFFYNKYIEQIESELQLKLAKLLPVKQIYSNINGLKIDGVLPMPMDLDWRKTPMGSIHFIDEIRDFYPYNNKDGRKVSTSGIILEMSKVRHTDKDVWLITQDAEDYNYSLRQLIDKMYFVKRPPSKMQACAVYVFDQYLSRPRSAADSTRDPKKYVDYFLVVYKKKYQNMYVSASSHTSMIKKINIKALGYVFLFLFTASIVVVGLMKIPIFTYFGTAMAMMSGPSKDDPLNMNPNKEQNNQPMTLADEHQLKEKVNLCVEQFGWTPDQCRQSLDPRFDQQQKEQLQALTRNDMQTVVFDYNPNKPYDVEYQPKKEPTDFPRFKNAIVYNNKCTAYSQQGTEMHGVSKEDCFRLANGDRPFDYFAVQQTAQPNQPIQNFNQSSEQKMSAEQYAKYLQYLDEKSQSNNYVQSHLQQNPVGGANSL